MRRLCLAVSIALVGSVRADSPPPDPLVTALIETLGDADQEVRQNAGIALGSVGPRAVPSLLAVLGDGNPNRRAGAAYALGRIGHGSREAVPALASALRDKDVNVRRQASLALGRVLAPELATGPVAPVLTGPSTPEPVFPDVPVPGARP